MNQEKKVTFTSKFSNREFIYNQELALKSLINYIYFYNKKVGLLKVNQHMAWLLD